MKIYSLVFAGLIAAIVAGLGFSVDLRAIKSAGHEHAEELRASVPATIVMVNSIETVTYSVNERRGFFVGPVAYSSWRISTDRGVWEWSPFNDGPATANLKVGRPVAAHLLESGHQLLLAKTK